MTSCSRRAASAVISAGLCWLGPAPLHASDVPEPAPAATPSALTRPTLKDALVITYPEGETRTASVVLELLVDRDGHVSDARVVSGEEPFATAALQALQGALFEPARRGDDPIPARIRLEVRFTPPMLESAPEPSDAPPGTSTRAAPAPPKAPIEISVLGVRPAPGRMTLSRTEVRELPGAFGDPFRAVEVMPGVTPIFTGVPFFYVRGSPPGNVGYFLDGVRVPLLYHVALGPSVIHPGLVERVDVYSGGYPARYGRYAGAIVSAETTAPRANLRGEGNVRLFDAGALAEAPFAGGRGSALLGGRYSYTAAILSLIAPEVTLSYWDYQARLSYALSPSWRVSAFGFGAYDLFRSDEESDSVGTQFHRVDLRLDHTPDARSKLRLGVMLGVDRSAAEDGRSRETTDPPALPGGDPPPMMPTQEMNGGRRSAPTLVDQLAGVRLEYERQLDPRLTLRAGADVNIDRYRIVDVASDDDNLGDFFPTRDDVTTGVRGDLVWEPERGVVVTPGLRADLYVSGGRKAIGIEPRIAAEFEINRRVRLEHSFGIAQQAPSFIVPIPGFSLSDLKDGLQRSLQSSAGVVVRPGAEFQLGLTLFHNAFFNLTDFLGTIGLREQATAANPEKDLEDQLDFRAQGQAYGLELVVKRPLTKRLGGYLAYTLSRTTRSFGLTRRKPASFDRTHVLHAALSLDLGRGYRAGARFSTYSGIPAQVEYTDRITVVNGRPTYAETKREYPRSPWFYRLDVRLEKRWSIDERGRYIALVLEMLNATLHKETPFITCNADGCEGDAIGPVSIPSIGAEVFF